jgi:N-acetylglucosamine kinase-like BadF-type ATPase
MGGHGIAGACDADRVIFVGIDAGGTSTRVGLDGDGVQAHWLLGSANPASTGGRFGDDIWLEAGRLLAQAAPSARDWEVLIGAADHSDGTLDRSAACATALAGQLPGHGRIRVINDTAALLFGPALRGDGVVAVAGTGSSIIARHAGRTTQVYGLEFLLSDEGSGYDVAVRALRAVVRAAQHLGPPTSLLAAAEEHYGAPIAAVARRLAVEASHKQIVAAFAAVVDREAGAGDAVAIEVVLGAATALADGVRAAVRQVGADVLDIVTVGSVITHSRLFRERFDEQIAPVVRTRHEAADGLATAMWLAREEFASAPLPLLEHRFGHPAGGQ